VDGLPVRRVLAVFAAPSADAPAATEFLRVLAALRAVRAEVRLVEAGRGVGTLSALEPVLEPDGERYLEALREEGVVPVARADLAAEVAAADSVLVLPDPGRAGAPALLRLPRGGHPPAEAVSAALRAGQVAVG
jgi:hypothetical protein